MLIQCWIRISPVHPDFDRQQGMSKSLSGFYIISSISLISWEFSLNKTFTLDKICPRAGTVYIRRFSHFVMCLDLAFWSCVLVLRLGLVTWSCVLVLCLDLMPWSCVMVLCHGLASWSGVIVLRHGLVSWSCVMILCHGLVSWSCVIVWCHCLLSLFCHCLESLSHVSPPKLRMFFLLRKKQTQFTPIVLGQYYS